MGVTLRPLRTDEFATWLPSTRDAYARDLEVNGGLSKDEAQRKANADTEHLFPGGAPSSDQLVFVIEADGEDVGRLWVAEREMDFGRSSLWIYDIHVKEAYRGHGYGREAMLFAEEEARRRGLDRVALNVFGGNKVARGLYHSLDYKENAVVMS